MPEQQLSYSNVTSILGTDHFKHFSFKLQEKINDYLQDDEMDLDEIVFLIGGQVEEDLFI